MNVLINDHQLRKGDAGVVCKLDPGKSYDHVNWSCLLYIVKFMNFGEKWIKWISTCMSTVTFSVLISGFPDAFLYFVGDWGREIHFLFIYLSQ